MYILLTKIAVLVGLLILKVYWKSAESDAMDNLPSTTTKRYGLRKRIQWVEYAFYITVIIQAFIINPFALPESIIIRAAGLLIFVGGAWISFLGRETLGDNWTHLVDYQVKERQQLITDGIYDHVRHPIYSGLILIVTGAEIALCSWLSVVFFLLTFVTLYAQSKKEDYLLARHFGKRYLIYQHHTKMFIPWIF